MFFNSNRYTSKHNEFELESTKACHMVLFKTPQMLNLIHKFKLAAPHHRDFTIKRKFDECLKKKDILIRIPKYRYTITPHSDDKQLYILTTNLFGRFSCIFILFFSMNKLHAPGAVCRNRPAIPWILSVKSSEGESRLRVTSIWNILETLAIV